MQSAFTKSNDYKLDMDIFMPYEHIQSDVTTPRHTDITFSRNITSWIFTFDHNKSIYIFIKTISTPM